VKFALDPVSAVNKRLPPMRALVVVRLECAIIAAHDDKGLDADDVSYCR
jgi:hypothetical protein